MPDAHTTAVVQRYLDELAGVAGTAPAEPIIRDLLAGAVDRLHRLCGALLHRRYPRLARPPLNLRADEMLGAVVERLLKAMRQVRPQSVRHFFVLANQHMRWELNDLARRIDERAPAVALRESLAGAAPAAHDGEEGDGEDDASRVGPAARRILDAIEALPPDEREAFNLVRVQGLTRPEAAAVLGVSEKTVQRRVKRGLMILTDRLGDLRAPGVPPPAPPEPRSGRPDESPPAGKA